MKKKEQMEKNIVEMCDDIRRRLPDNVKSDDVAYLLSTINFLLTLQSLKEQK